MQLVPMGHHARMRPSTSAGRLSTVASGRISNDDDFSSRVRRGGAALALHQQTPPWQSRAVLRLASAATSKSKDTVAGEKVEPMLVEGPRGTSLRALGFKEDHKVRLFSPPAMHKCPHGCGLENTARHDFMTYTRQARSQNVEPVS